MVIQSEGFLTLMTCRWSLQNKDDSECDLCPSSIPIWNTWLFWWLKTHSPPIFSPLYYSFLRNLTWPSWSSLGLLRVDTELCAIPPLGVSLLHSGCGTQEEGKEKSCSYLHRFWRAPFLQGFVHLQPMTPAQGRITTSGPRCPSELKTAPCSSVCLGNSPGFQKQWMAISVTAVVLSGFHPHQSVVLFICSVPFLPPEPA